MGTSCSELEAKSILPTRGAGVLARPVLKNAHRDSRASLAAHSLGGSQRDVLGCHCLCN